MIDRRMLAILIAGSGIAAAAWSADTPAPKAYVVGEMTVKDAASYRAYADLAAPIIRKYGGNFVVRGGQTVSVEGTAPGRIVIIEFASLDAAKRFENSPEYTTIAPIRQKAAESRLYLVEGTVAAP